MTTSDEQAPGRLASLGYNVALGICGLWMLVSGAGWIAFTAFVAMSLGALGVFSNRVWKHPRYMQRPLDSSLALVGSGALLAFPAVLVLGSAGRTRCLAAIVVHVVVGLLMTSPPYRGRKRLRRSRLSKACDGEKSPLDGM